MPEPEIRVLDMEGVQDPETLLLLLDDMMNQNKVAVRAIAVVSVLLLNHLGELDAPAGEPEKSIALLHSFLGEVGRSLRYWQMADSIRDLLEAQE